MPLNGNKLCKALFFRQSIGLGELFGGDYDILPFSEVPQGTAQILLAGTALVADGSIKEIDAQFHPPLDDIPGVFLIQRPAVLAVVWGAKPHAAHTDAGNSQAGISKFCIPHSAPSLLQAAVGRIVHWFAPLV